MHGNRAGRKSRWQIAVDDDADMAFKAMAGRGLCASVRSE